MAGPGLLHPALLPQDVSSEVRILIGVTEPKSGTPSCVFSGNQLYHTWDVSSNEYSWMSHMWQRRELELKLIGIFQTRMFCQKMLLCFSQSPVKILNFNGLQGNACRPVIISCHPA